MCPKRHRLQYLLPAIAILGAAIGWSSPSDAYVQQIVIDQTATVNFAPIPLGSSVAGPPVSYTVYQGRIIGQLNTSDAHNAIITDIFQASSTGAAQYVANFQIITPTNPAQRSGLMIHEVPNRGGNAIGTGALIQGATYVQSGWQGDLLSQCATVSPVPLYPCFDLNSGPYGSLNTTTGAFTPPSLGSPAAALASYVVQVPVATTDGNPPNGTNTITGSVYGHICTGAGGCGLATGSAATPTSLMQIQAAAFVPYQPAGYNPASPGPSLATSQSTTNPQFWSVPSQTFTGVDGPQTPISIANWTWADCPASGGGPPGTPNPYFICLSSGTFNPNLLYEMVYTAQNPLVLGVGFAAFRDLGSFLRYGSTAPGGGTNPIAGTVTKAMTVGGSQSAAFIHGLIFWGFNQDESNRIVFDGAWPQIDGRMMVMNIRWGQPNNLMYLYMGGDEAPVWWADYPNLARNLPADGMLHRCNATNPNTCPQVLETFGSAEIYSEKFSASLCGFTCVADIPLPSNVYRYFTAGATHGGGAVSFNWQAPGTVTIPAGQVAPNSPIPETFTNNALQADFIGLLMNGTSMPPSVYPTLAKGELVPNTQAAEGFPNIPGVTYAGNQAWVPFVYNFGPEENYDQESGVPTIQPPTIQLVLPGIGVKVNADGNENVTGLPSVLGQAPLATYVGWNLQTAGWYGPGLNSPVGQVFAGAGNSGAYYPFWDTQAHRVSAGDPRLSLEERYGTHAGYYCVVRQAANSAVEQRFLLVSDAQTLISLASASNVLGSPFTPTTADTSVTDHLCGLTVTHDFSGEGNSDILWRDTSGNVGTWLMNGSQIVKGATIGIVPSVWSIVGQRDFNGDGNADVLWRDASGNVGMWLMNGTQIVQSAVIGNVPTNWSIAGTGDFNGDGKGDILWVDTSGNLGIWFMNGTTITQTAVVGQLPSNCNVVGSDMKGDIFLRNTSNGDVGIWVMNGTKIAQSVDFGPAPLNWTVAGIGDFDGNGSDDILWRDTSGNVVMWLLNGIQFISGTTIANVPTFWSIAETGDYNGDGKSDILWVDNQGNVGIWFMNSTSVSSVTNYGNVGTSWSVQSLAAE
jgi:hypothetical protein